MTVKELDSELVELVNPLVEKLERVRIERAELENKLAGIKANERKITKTIEYLTGEPAPGNDRKGHARSNGNGNYGKYASDESIEKVIAFIRENPPDSVVPEIEKGVGLNGNTVRAAIKQLRADELVRRTQDRYAAGVERGTKAAAFGLMGD